jgi:Dolichyl-phosphate-mannose-protein mannosyltransferase
MINRRDKVSIFSLFVASFAIRLFLAARIVFPPLDDPAFYIQSARNIAIGRGLVIDVIWNYFVPFNSVTHASHEFWLPLSSIVMAGSIKIFGDTLGAAQLPGIISGALLPVLTYLIGRYLWPDQRRWSILAAALIIPSAILVYQSANADSSALYTLLSTSALFTSVSVLKWRQLWLAALVGVLCGLSYLTRSFGSLLPIGIGIMWLTQLRNDRMILIKMIAAAGIGLFIIVLPWWLRNQSVFGSIQPSSLMTAMSARDYGEWFNYTDLPSLQKLFSQDIGSILALRLDGLLRSLGVILLISFPFGLIGLPMALFRREPIWRAFTAYHLLLIFVASFIFTIPTVTGSFYHSAGTFAIWAAVGFVALIKDWWARSPRRLWAIAASMTCAALVIGQAIIAWPVVIADSRSNFEKFTSIADWLHHAASIDQPVITTEAHSLNYASGYPTLTLPNQQSIDVVRALADRYGARYVVITESVGLYPDALNQAGVKLAADVSGALIYDLKP